MPMITGSYLQAFYTSPLHLAKSTPSLVDSASSPEGSLKNKWMNSVDSLDTVSSAASSGGAKREEHSNRSGIPIQKFRAFFEELESLQFLFL